MNHTPLTPEERKRLNAIFSRLWGNRTGVVGSFPASSSGRHPTFIRRGPLFLEGETAFRCLHVLTPADARVTPKPLDPAAHFDCFPEIDGGSVFIHDSNPGPWWDALRAELPKMEAELAASEERAAAERRATEEKERAARQAELDRAAAVFGGTAA